MTLEKIIAYFAKNSDFFWSSVAQHLGITLVAVAAACLVGIPAGILCARNQRVKTVVTGLFTTLRIIPSLAVLLLCIPLIGTGLKPAVIALSFLAMPPLLINTTLAFSTIPAPILETALGMGMSRARTFFLVKIPLALPLILAGFKTAVVEVIASATLAAYIGAGGLGAIIFTGLGLLRADLLLIGGVSVAIISITADFLLTRLERRLLRYQQPAC